jgi:hypothetical protein
MSCPRTPENSESPGDAAWVIPFTAFDAVESPSIAGLEPSDSPATAYPVVEMPRTPIPNVLPLALYSPKTPKGYLIFVFALAATSP